MLKAQRAFAKVATAVLAAVAALLLRADLASVEYTNAETNWVGGELVLKFTNAAETATFTLPGPGTARILAVGGGGAGGTGAKNLLAGAGAGGGGGGFVETNGIILASGTYSISVGAGGSPGTAAGGNGQDSSITLSGSNIIRALGGGGGGAQTTGSAGGSGGGGSKSGTAGGAATQPGLAFGGYGNAGGSGSHNRVGGGGGGAGASGGNTVAVGTAGGGGAGRSSTIFDDTEIWYAGGGGGGAKAHTSLSVGGTGGVGGGGNGGFGVSTTSHTAAEPGVDGTGGGGGGGNDASSGGKGGDGVVIVRLKTVLDGPLEKPSAEPVYYTGAAITKIVTEGYEFAFQEIQGATSATDAGTYHLKLVLADGFKWNDGTSDVFDEDWKILKATNYITNLRIDSWRIGNPEGEPMCEHEFGDVIYEYSTSKSGTYSTIKPTKAGKYYLRARIAGTDNYDGVSGVYAESPFEIFPAQESPTETLGMTAKIVVRETIPVEEATNTLVAVVIKDGVPAGFKYSQALPNGADVRFFDKDGNILPHKNQSWNVNGVSTNLVYLSNLAYGSEIYMAWGKTVGSGEIPSSSESVDWNSKEGRVYVPSNDNTMGESVKDWRYKLENRWTTNPKLSKLSWSEGDAPATVTKGESIMGVVAPFFVTLPDGTRLDEMPTTRGVYNAVFFCEETFYYAELSETIEFEILGFTPYDDLSGEVGMTESGRVLLMNNDESIGTPVTGQGYSDTNTANSTYWTFYDREFGSGIHNLMPGASSALFRNNGALLWKLENCLHGNVFRKARSDMASSSIHMPWSENSSVFTNSAQKTGNDGRGSSQVLMMNTTGAVVYSSCFEDGIGTIYFDAANSSASEGDFDIVVEVATNVTGSADAPLDDNIYTVITNVVEETGEETYTTNYYGKADWQAVDMIPLVRDGSGGFSALSPTNALSLNITSSGSNANFYRVYIPLNYRCPARFRIKRTTAKDSENANNILYLVELDNIIVSYPPMRVDLEPYGIFDSEKSGKNTLGWEAAFNTPFPAAGAEDVLARAKNTYSLNSSTNLTSSGDMVTVSRMWYRWRYLDQTNTAWKTVVLNHKSAAYDALSALDLPRGPGGDALPGDVEFWYETKLNAPYYKYLDYSGTGLGVPDYTENIPVVTNRCLAGDIYESRGTNWFVRLREWSSEYEAINLEWTPARGGPTNSIPMELVMGNTFRGYLQTKTKDSGGILYRFETLNLQTPGDTAFAYSTNYWRSADGTNSLPVTGMVELTDTNGWAHVPCDAATGYLLFQLDHQSRALTVVHADYQNFNGWSDAKTADKKFVGCSEEDGNANKTGVSSKARTMEESFDTWSDMPATNAFWTERFETTLAQEYGYYTNFSATASPNGWDVGPGMWCYGYYKDSSTGRALQMEGNGFGYIQMTHTPTVPRGLETITMRARLAQFVEFEDFCYHDAAGKSRMTNYTFTARGAFDLEKNKSFGGNASLSLVAHYVPGKGCYEFRVEQIGGTSSGVKPANQRLSLYRWSFDEAGMVEEECLGSADKTTFDWPETSSTNGYFVPMFISVSNTTEVVVKSGVTVTNDVVCIAAGIMLGRYASNDKTIAPAGDKALGVVADADVNFYTGAGGGVKRFMLFEYRDANQQKQHKGGTYGFLSANSVGMVMKPAFFPEPVPFPGQFTTDNALNIVGLTASAYTGGTTLTFPTNDVVECYKDFDSWYFSPGKMDPFVFTNSANQVYWGAGVRNPSQDIKVYTAPSSGSSGWSLAGTRHFTNFGSFAKTQTFTFYITPDIHIKIAAGGTRRERRTDVVIDDIEVKQWRGDDWENIGRAHIPTWVSESVSAAHTNFIIGSAWIKNKSVLLSAKRTAPGTGSYIRSPLFDGSASDGSFDRGTGLGMFAFSYANAQTNANLLFQIATNVSYSTINGINAPDSRAWITVTNFDFSVLSDSERARGSRSVYLGLRGVKGVMRLIVDPKIVNAIANNKDKMDKNVFGEINITGVVCRDEPEIDDSSWWGWNLRTFGAEDSKDPENKMFLADLNNDYKQRGLSLALNNSVIDDIKYTKVKDTDDKDLFKEHQPFVQTPYFATNIVGEISFKARKYDLSNTQPAQVTIYGSRTGADGSPWTRLGHFIISNSVYTTYSYKTEPNDSYAAFRLAVTGVPGVKDKNVDNRVPEGYDSPVRVLIDEVVVSEAVRVRMAFRNVGAFRKLPTDNALYSTTMVPNVPSAERQPLCNENWGIQCEVYPAQLADEIDLSINPSVKLMWFPARYPWGWENWKNDSRARSAWLARATDTNLIYRSSFVTAPKAIIDPSSSPGSVVQYMLEVVYYQRGSTTPITNRLSSAEWTKPEWYRGIEYNRDSGDGAFAAYNILDTVAPYWAWINEVNLFGGYDASWYNNDRLRQYVEIAVPAEADISTWHVDLVVAHDTSHMIYTNVLATFGENGLDGTKKDLIGMESNMVFRVIASPLAREYQQLDASKGEIDGVWYTPVNPITEFTASGEINAMSPVGFRLVRGSGIIEHEVVAIGTNYYSRADMPESLRKSHSPDYIAEWMNGNMQDTAFFAVPEDSFAAGASIGVFESSGETAESWTNIYVKTPGRINGGQSINPNHPTPNGASLIIYANLAPFGHIVQSLGNEYVNTNGNVILIVPKGLAGGTNITYTVDKWYELASVTTNDKPAVAASPTPGTYVINVANNCSNNVNVIATAKVSDYITSLGITEENRYSRAVMDWLKNGVDAYGKPWENRDATEVSLADYLDYNGTVVKNLSLTEMYWLDMDPTAGNLALKAHFARCPTNEVVTYPCGQTETNVNVAVYMAITNRTTGKAWTPYVLRGLEPGSKSWEITESDSAAWTSVTFKVTGIMNNGMVDLSSFSEDWIPLRWFVFQEDSFRPLDDAENPGVSFIDVTDPHSTSSPGYAAGWYRYPALTPWFGWALDDRLKPYTVESLKEGNDL